MQGGAAVGRLGVRCLWTALINQLQLMALNVASRLGHYDVTALIGAGGVGEMYRARDTSLDRDGALKVPAPAFSDDTGLNPDEFKIRAQLTQDGLIAKPSTNRAILTRVPATRETFNGRQGWSEGQEQGPEAEGREGRRKEEAETGQAGESQTRLSRGCAKNSRVSYLRTDVFTTLHTLGSYSVTATIGEDGMGEASRARETRLDRDVPLNALPQAQ